MRHLTLFFLLFIFSKAFAQTAGQPERYYFYVTVSDPNSLNISQNSSGTLSVKNPENPKETAIFGAYNVFEFQPAFLNTRSERLKNVYSIVTDDVKLLGGLLRQFPEKYSRIDQFYPDETAYFPNDYGTTSPVENLGAKHPLYDLDLVNAPGAWGITRGSHKVVVGISDSKIDSTNADIQGRISNYINYFKYTSGMLCGHGTNVAGIAIAKIDNAYGRPGLCPNCDVVANGYGNFRKIEELVAAGARVINASWARCNMGPYHEDIEERINELYEDGIIIVAGAGNGKNCNKDDDYPPDDYAYPASYEKVISVTGVYTIYDKPEDNTYIGKEGRPTAGYLKDRHSSEYGVLNDGGLHPKYRQWDMQFNKSIDLCAPSQSYLLGNDICGEKSIYGGATSSAAPYITGVIGLMWSVNYCLDAYETESILKLTAAHIEDLPGNEYYKGQLGAGRVDAYKAVKMARDMKEFMGRVEISGRDFTRFTFKLEHAPFDIQLENQTFRDSAKVDFKARHQIILKPGTRLAPDTIGEMHLSIDPAIPTDECFPKPVKDYPSLFEQKPKEDIKHNAILNSFSVSFDTSSKAVVVSALNMADSRLRGKPYTVKILSPSEKKLREQLFNFPEKGVIEVDFGNLSYLIVEITIDGKTEVYRVKRS